MYLRNFANRFINPSTPAPSEEGVGIERSWIGQPVVAVVFISTVVPPTIASAVPKGLPSELRRTQRAKLEARRGWHTLCELRTLGWPTPAGLVYARGGHS